MSGNKKEKYTTDADVQKEIASWKVHVKEDAMETIHKIMAQKCLYLTSLLKEDLILSSSLPFTTPLGDTVEDGPATKKRKLDNGNGENTSSIVDPSQTNSRVVHLLDKLKKETLEFVSSIHSIRLYIQIQEEVLNELSRAEDAAYSVLDAGTKYFVTRGKLVSKVEKYSSIYDYKLSVSSLDQKQEIELRLAFKDLRNNYALLDDLVQKNIEKLTKPRTSNLTSLY